MQGTEAGTKVLNSHDFNLEIENIMESTLDVRHIIGIRRLSDKRTKEFELLEGMKWKAEGVWERGDFGYIRKLKRYG